MNKLNHIAFIMDGNGRWGKNKNKGRNYGHLKGVETVKKIVGSLSSDNLSFLRSSDLKLGDPRIISNKNAITKLVVYYLMNEKIK